MSTLASSHWPKSFVSSMYGVYEMLTNSLDLGGPEAGRPLPSQTTRFRQGEMRMWACTNAPESTAGHTREGSNLLSWTTWDSILQSCLRMAVPRRRYIYRVGVFAGAADAAQNLHRLGMFEVGAEV
jgi:hypothetical protein